MRQILVKIANEYGKITWGSSCSEVSNYQDERLHLRFDDGKEDVCDFLIAADDANSRIRKCLRSHDTLNFVESINISVIFRFSESPPHPLNKD